jgi:hypothetical protein
LYIEHDWEIPNIRGFAPPGGNMWQTYPKKSAPTMSSNLGSLLRVGEKKKRREVLRPATSRHVQQLYFLHPGNENGSAGFNVTSKAGCGECPKSGSGLKPQVFQRKLLIVSPMMMMILFHLQTACMYLLYCRK